MPKKYLQMININGYLEPESFRNLIKQKQNFKLLGLDIGRKKIGLAICNTELSLPFPLTTLIRKTPQYDVLSLIDIIKENGVEGIIAGLPLSNSEQNNNIRYIIVFLERLFVHLDNIPITFQDESFTTQDADELLLAINMKRAKRNIIDDAVAASLILDRFLKKQFLFESKVFGQ